MRCGSLPPDSAGGGAAAPFRPRPLSPCESYALLCDCVIQTRALDETILNPCCWGTQDLSALAPIREAAEIVAAKADWGPLYDLQVLAQVPVRTASATYYEVAFSLHVTYASLCILTDSLILVHRLL